MTNRERRQLLDRFRASGMEGSILDVYQAYGQGRDLIAEHYEQQQQQEPVVLTTPQEQQQGLRPYHAAGDMNRSAVFKDVPPHTPFNTHGMSRPINIEKYDEQGHLVESHKSIPPGISDIPTGPHRGDVIETPAEGYRDGGFVKKMKTGGEFAEKSGLSPEEYSKAYNEAVEKYGEDAALAFDPQTRTFGVGNQMLPTAEVSAKFEPKTKEERDAYNNLGVAGALQMRNMQRGVTGARNKFAKDYMVPVADAVMMATGAGEAVALGRGAAMLGRGALKLGAKGAKNLYKINPFATKSIPSKADHYYRVVPGKAYDDLVESGVVRARSTQAPEGASLLEQMKYRPTSRASFAKGKAMPEYGKGDPRAVVIEAGPREGAWMNRATKKNPVTGKRTPRPSGRHFADFALDPKTGKMTDIPKSDVTNVYRATPHFLKGYEKLPYLRGGVRRRRKRK